MREAPQEGENSKTAESFQAFAKRVGVDVEFEKLGQRTPHQLVCMFENLVAEAPMYAVEILVVVQTVGTLFGRDRYGMSFFFHCFLWRR